MDTPQDENEINSLENSGSVTAGGGPAEDEPEKDTSGDKKEPAKKQKVNARVQGLIARVNIYLLMFILILVLAGGIVFVSMQRSKKEAIQNDLETQQLTPEELDKIRGSDAKVGDPKQTLTIESNAVFSGKVLVRGDIDVAGAIKVGGALNLPGITVSGESKFDQVTANQLSVAGDVSIQGAVNIQRNLSVSGSATFGGPISAPQITIGSLQINNDLTFGRHLDAGGGTPGRTNGTALGSGGTTSISGTDTAGTVSINTGSSPGAGCFVRVNFTQQFNGTPHVVITPVGSAGASVRYYITQRTTAGFTICSANTPPNGASFAFDYIVID